MVKIIILTAAILSVILIVVFIRKNTRTMSKAEAELKIQKLLNKAVNKNNISGATVYLDSEKWGQHLFTAGEHSSTEQSFHIASSGKAFTASLIGVLIDEGRVSLESRIAEILQPEITAGLFVVNGVDYREEVTVGQLLNHTSGIADYFEDGSAGSASIQELISTEPERLWTPQQLAAFTRDFQQTVGKPGEQFHYSDTGYILLGLIIEQISGKSFAQMLHENIFSPLKMKDSYLMFYSEAEQGKSLADIWLNGINIKDFKSLSIDWAGGGIVSTADNLAVFIRALNNYEIVTAETLSKLYQFDESFMRGIHYGYGFMEYHFGEFFPTLNSMPLFRGHMGILGTQMFYNKETDTVYISNFGSTDFAADSVKMMISVIGYIDRIKKDR